MHRATSPEPGSLKTLLGSFSHTTEASELTDDVRGCEVIRFDGMPEADVGRVLTMSARALIEQEPNYSYVAARLYLMPYAMRL